jgi:hypothetical protein
MRSFAHIITRSRNTPFSSDSLRGDKCKRSFAAFAFCPCPAEREGKRRRPGPSDPPQKPDARPTHAWSAERGSIRRYNLLEFDDGTAARRARGKVQAHRSLARSAKHQLRRGIGCAIEADVLKADACATMGANTGVACSRRHRGWVAIDSFGYGQFESRNSDIE